MTSETVASEGAAESGGDDPSHVSPPANVATMTFESDRVARRHFLVAALFLVVGMAALLLAWIDVTSPGSLAAPFSYGMLRPVGMGLIVYGWLTTGLIGAAYYVLPRLGAAELQKTGLANLGLLALVAGVVAGVVGIFAGLNEGRLLLEFPLWADAGIAVGLLVAAVVVTSSVRASGDDDLLPAQWFLLAAPWWAVIVFVAGNIPGINGVNSALQTNFFLASFTGLWLAAGGLGVVYYLVPAVTGRPPRRANALSLTVFWSLAFAWAWTAPRYAVYGPIPDWLETIGVFFSIGLLVPVLAVASELAVTLRGRWTTATESVPLLFAIAGTAMFGVGVLVNLMLALRSSSAVVQFTAWVASYDQLLYLGAFTFWLVAFGYHAFGGGASRLTAHLHLWLAVLSVGVLVAASWFSGLQAGFTWAAGTNSLDYASVGDGFRNTIGQLAGPITLQAAGLTVLFLAHVIFVLVMVRGGGPMPCDDPVVEAEEPEALEPTPVSGRTIVRGAIGMVALAALAVWILPSFESGHTEATLLGDTVRARPAGSAEAAGQDIYVQEGCWYCHTQQVRPIVTDVGLGPVSQAGDYANESPALFGVERIGPDLTHVGSRAPTDSAVWVVDHLKDPSSIRPWSRMPAYDHLSAQQLADLAAYMTSLD